ncbi:MAG: NifB/NifX family molybdenum-iron cluster-binding protein [Georgenia sp.]
MTVIVPVTTEGRTGHSWGKAPRVAVATVSAGTITAWQETDVRWDASHDEGTEGSHHARIARFLKDHDVDTVLAHHMGPGMQRMLATMEITVRPVAAGADARAAVLAAVAGD